MVDWKKIRFRFDAIGDHQFSVRDRFRADNFDLLLEACRERDERIEFLEKALEQALSDGPDWGATEPELAAYLEEKNG